MTTNENTPTKKNHTTLYIIGGAVIALLVGFGIGQASVAEPDVDASTATTATVTAPAETVTQDAPAPETVKVTEPAVTTTVTNEPTGAPMDLMTDSQLQACQDAMSTDAGAVMSLVGDALQIGMDSMNAAAEYDVAGLTDAGDRIESLTGDADRVSATFISNRDICFDGLLGSN